jgi:hypothetical protein
MLADAGWCEQHSIHRVLLGGALTKSSRRGILQCSPARDCGDEEVRMNQEVSMTQV